MNLSVIGLGKLGLVLATLHAETSRVIGIDVDPRTVRRINNGECPIEEPGLELLMKQVVKDGNLTAHNDFKHVAESDASLIIVPTPSFPNGGFDSHYVVAACRSIGKAIRHKRERHTVIVCSTVMPGTCDKLIRPALEEAAGKRVGLIYSPEFIALGSVISNMRYPDMTLIGESDPESGKHYEEIANKIIDRTAPTYHMDLTSAETAKIALNAYVTMKISFANSLGELCEKIGADAPMVARAIGADRRIGSRYLSPAVAFGGPCFPRDNRAFQRVGLQVGLSLPLSVATDEVNDRQVATMVDRIEKTNRTHVGILGLSYKPNTAITERSFGIQLATELLHRNYQVDVYDPLVKEQEGLLPRAGWKEGPSDLISNEILTVLCTPDPAFTSLFPIIFSTPERQRALVYDCWGVIARGPWDATNVLGIGV